MRFWLHWLSDYPKISSEHLLRDADVYYPLSHEWRKSSFKPPVVLTDKLMTTLILWEKLKSGYVSDLYSTPYVKYTMFNIFAFVLLITHIRTGQLGNCTCYNLKSIDLSLAFKPESSKSLKQYLNSDKVLFYQLTVSYQMQTGN